MPTYRRTFPGRPEEIGRARRWTYTVLNGSPHADDAALIVTELSTNALLHSASGNPGETFDIVLTRTAGRLAISVTDSGAASTSPRVELPGEYEAHGRGLALAAQLAQRLYVQGDDRYGHTVTAEFHVADRHETANLQATPGYWCECVVNGSTLGAFDTTSPEQALRWVRISLMTIATALDEEPYRRARHWTQEEQPQALRALRLGTPQALTLKHRTTAMTWTARPVTFLPLAHRQGVRLPSCSQQHATITRGPR